jgi:predicted ribosome quality control (RQC) complex YloA/Tae2 family protein
MSDTPETDAAWSCFKGYMEPLQDVKDLSRKLERERDEAREKAERYRLEANAIMMQRDEVQKKLEYYKERYEQLKEIPKWYNGREIPAEIKEETK